jgi:tRNA(Ile)-lysidine synthase
MIAGDSHSHLASAISAVPPGHWAVGVSGGADSVALLALLHDRTDLKLHVVHLNHETRGKESAGDAEFVAALATKWNIPCTVGAISELALPLPPRNTAARFRAARMSLFDRVVQAHRLSGVILAHHADDQAETILHRLLRGAGPASLIGIRPAARIGGLNVLHPLLPCRRSELRQELTDRKLAWREDVSNESPRFLRNRLRKLLRDRPMLTDALLELGHACGAYEQLLDRHAPLLGEQFAVEDLRNIPSPLGRHAARRWLQERDADVEQINAATVDRLMAMARDAATPPRQHFPGGLLVRRVRGVITVDKKISESSR